MDPNAPRGWRSPLLAARMPRDLRKKIDKVVSPAMGGSSSATKWAARWQVEAMFVERPTGTFELRRGFAIEPGERC
jgi:orotate phosphoribosyltransferase